MLLIDEKVKKELNDKLDVIEKELAVKELNELINIIKVEDEK